MIFGIGCDCSAARLVAIADSGIFVPQPVPDKFGVNVSCRPCRSSRLVDRRHWRVTLSAPAEDACAEAESPTRMARAFWFSEKNDGPGSRMGRISDACRGHRRASPPLSNVAGGRDARCASGRWVDRADYRADIQRLRGQTVGHRRICRNLARKASIFIRVSACRGCSRM